MGPMIFIIPMLPIIPIGVRLLHCSLLLVAIALLRSQLRQKDVVAASIGDRMAAELRGSAAGSGEVQVALAVRHDRVGVVGSVASRLLEPPQRSGSVVLHDVDSRGTVRQLEPSIR